MSKKYELSGEKNENGLRQIKALRAFSNVNAGDLGGWVKSEANLSHDGDCWVYGNAQVFDNVQVFGNARIFGNAKVYGKAQVYDGAEVYGNAQVYGYASVSGNTRVFGNAKVYGYAQVYGLAQVSGDGQVWGDAKVFDNALVSGNINSGKHDGSDKQTESKVTKMNTGLDEGKLYATTKDGVRTLVKSGSEKEAAAIRNSYSNPKKDPAYIAPPRTRTASPSLVNYQSLAFEIEQQVNAHTPDSDGWDALEKYFKKKYPSINIYDMAKHLNLACKKHLGEKDFDSYVLATANDYEKMHEETKFTGANMNTDQSLSTLKSLLEASKFYGNASHPPHYDDVKKQLKGSVMDWMTSLGIDKSELRDAVKHFKTTGASLIKRATTIGLELDPNWPATEKNGTLTFRKDLMKRDGKGDQMYVYYRIYANGQIRREDHWGRMTRLVSPKPVVVAGQDKVEMLNGIYSASLTELIRKLAAKHDEDN